LLAVAFMTCCSLSAIAQEVEEAIEHEGNKYTIHVEQLNPDPEMSLLDLLHICPELMSSDGKALTADYLLSVDDIMLSVDYEPLLEGIKASDLSEVTVCTYGAVNNGMDGTTGSLDLKFKEGKGLTGKVGLNGSTYGNGLLYADIAKEGENVTVRAFTQAHLKYGRSLILPWMPPPCDNYPNIVHKRYMKNGTSATPCTCALKPLIFEFRDSAEAFECLSLK